jgi:hypothetical protein
MFVFSIAGNHQSNKIIWAGGANQIIDNRKTQLITNILKMH